VQRPLEGIVVVDFTAMVSGASCTRLLADCGAEVIKVESSDGGDLMRQVPPYQDGVGLIYALYNAGKKSIVLDLKAPAGLAIARRLIEQADIVVENFRPGVMDRLELGYQSVAALNPKVVYCSISGFGQSGPLSDRAAYAPVAHAFSGVDMMLSRTVAPDAPPFDNRLMIADIQAGHHAFAAIQTALLHRLRHGAGSHVDVTMAEGMMGLVGMQFQQAQGGLDYSTAGFPWFRTLDGYVNIPLVSPNTFRCACRVIGREDWAADPDYASFAGMTAHREEIRAAVSAWTEAHTSVDCDAAMNAAGAPCAIYYTPDELLQHPHVAARGSFADIETASGSFKVINPPFRISGATCAAVPFVSALGADTREVLAARLGCDEASFARLAAENAFGPGWAPATPEPAS
jgi:crotonobetainyl-CoA:carnitine CoA-transferase CaiB-like acyl-CoA transferase